MKRMTIEEKAYIYFGRYRTGGSCTTKEYLTIMDEAREVGSLRAKIEEIRKDNRRSFER